jgi:hypothetical protein
MAKRSRPTSELRDPRIPGFNAEVSLYTSPATYRSRGDTSAFGAIPRIVAAITLAPVALQALSIVARGFISLGVTSKWGQCGCQPLFSAIGSYLTAL